MSTASTPFPTYNPAPNAAPSEHRISIECACDEEAHKENNFFRGIFVAVPAGLAMWVGLLKLATVIAHHI